MDPNPLLFSIHRGVCHRCSLAPYLFLIIVKVLNCMIKKGVEEGRIYGIVLPIENRQQVIAQFVDDISFTLQGKEGLIKVLLNVLQTFYFSSGLVLN